MALTIEQLYQQYAGRAPDPEGLAYWTRDFGSTIDPREVEVFKAAVAEARAQGTEPTAQPAYFQQNPDVAAAYRQNSYGLTPEQFAAAHYTNFGINEQRAAPASTPAVAPTPAPAVAPAPAPAPLTVADLYRQIGGREGDPEGIAYWNSQFGTTLEDSEISRFRDVILNDNVKPFEQTLQNKDTDFYTALAQIPALGPAAQNLYTEIIDQQNRGSSEFWYAGNTASKEAAAAQFAAQLAKQGVSSLSQIGQATVPGSFGGEAGDTPDQQVTVNKLTGEQINLGSNKGLDIDYNFAFTADGNVIPYTSNRQSSWMSFRENALKPAAAFALAAFGAPMIGAAVAPGLAAATQGAIGGAIAGGGSAALTGGNVLQGALLGGAGGYFQGANAGANAVAPGLGPQTDASFLAADAAQLASQGLSETAIAQVLGASGYASGPAASLAASMAVNGLDVGMMTQQLDALSTNTGLMSQTGSSADFLAADALQLQGQLGNNFPAIEQNLIASGVDPLIAADISQQLAFNPGLTQTQLAGNLSTSFGNNIYDVNMAQTYPTSVLPGAGGLLSNVPPASSVSTTTGSNVTTGGATSGLTPSQIANLIRAGVGLAGVTGAVSAVSGGGSNTPLQAPTQGMPTNTPEYYQQLQQYYNAYLPQTPRDVVTPLQQWYNSSYGA